MFVIKKKKLKKKEKKLKKMKRKKNSCIWTFLKLSDWWVNRTKPKTNRADDKWHPQKFLIDRNFVGSIWRMASIKLTGQNRSERIESLWLWTSWIFRGEKIIFIPIHTPSPSPPKMSTNFSFFQNNMGWAANIGNKRNRERERKRKSKKIKVIDRKSLQLKFPQLCEHNAFYRILYGVNEQNFYPSQFIKMRLKVLSFGLDQWQRKYSNALKKWRLELIIIQKSREAESDRELNNEKACRRHK